MFKQTLAALTVIAATSGAATAQDAFVGTWSGRLPSGTPVQVDIPAGYAQGQPVI